MVWQAAAGFGMGVAGSLIKTKAKGKAMLADSKLQTERLEYIRERQSETYQSNKTSVNRSEMINAAEIENSRLQAESDVSASFAGSGISGQSVNDIDAEVSADAAKAHNENVRAAEETKSDLFSQERRSIEDQKFDIQQMPSLDADAEITNAALTGVSQGLALSR